MNIKEKPINKRKLLDLGIDSNISVAKPEDIDEIIHLEETCFNPKEYTLLTKKQAQSAIKGNAIFLVARNEGLIIGYTQVMMSRPSVRFSGRIYSIAVHPDFQRKGIASQLLMSVEKIAAFLGCDELRLEIKEDNQSSKNRYEKMGYKVCRKVKDYYPDGLAALKMRKKL